MSIIYIIRSYVTSCHKVSDGTYSDYKTHGGLKMLAYIPNSLKKSVKRMDLFLRNYLLYVEDNESGPSNCCRWSDVFANPASKPFIIDVRSPNEFNEDHIHGAVNIPVLSDHVHACLYGASLICANISHCLKELAYQYTSESNNSVINKKFLKYPNFLIYCWRGGQRSSSLATILSEIDAWPRWSILSPFWVISGLTGSGKSLILCELQDEGEIVFDLEKLAKHKGSMFGAIDCHLAKIFYGLSVNRGILDHYVVCRNGLWSRLASTNPNIGTHRLWIDITEEARVAWILENYANTTQNIPQIIAILKNL
ncbi:tRNA 2-selenouridine/geranyl-2-thiouridine synthase [Schistosoma japonicum]|nr:tRNA 2-selenouridine/geranyl-2-thiouridine synthase [Schistosoma japonicum]